MSYDAIAFDRVRSCLQSKNAGVDAILDRECLCTGSNSSSRERERARKILVQTSIQRDRFEIKAAYIRMLGKGGKKTVWQSGSRCARCLRPSIVKARWLVASSAGRESWPCYGCWSPRQSRREGTAADKKIEKSG